MLLENVFARHKWTDEDIVKGILGSERERNKAIEALYEQNRTFLVRFLQNKSNEMYLVKEPNDIIWESIMAVLNNVLDGKYELQSTPLSGYLVTICKNLWHKNISQEANRAERETNFLDENVTKSPDISLIISNKQSWERYLKIFDSAGKNCKQIFTLWLVDGMDNKEIAAVMIKEGKLNSEQSVRNAKSDCLKRVTTSILSTNG